MLKYFVKQECRGWRLGKKSYVYLGMLPSQFLLAIFGPSSPPIAARWKSAATVMQTMMPMATAMPLSMAVVMIEAKAYMVSSSESSSNMRNSESCMLETKTSAKSSLPRQLTLQLSGSLILEPSFSQKVLTIFCRNRRTWNLSGILWDFSAPQPSPVPTTNACVGCWSPGQDLSVPQLPFYNWESAVWPTLRRSNGRPSFNDIEV